MKLLIHDISAEVFSGLGISANDMLIIAAKGQYAPCIGCFGCWLKTPGYCYIKDGLQHIGAASGQSDEVIVISEIWYGGYSAAVKNVLDRSISASTPFFTYRGGRIHHGRRYKTMRALKVLFYGDCTDSEKETARKLIEANRHNSGYKSADVFFAQNLHDTGCLEVLR